MDITVSEESGTQRSYKTEVYAPLNEEEVGQAGAIGMGMGIAAIFNSKKSSDNHADLNLYEDEGQVPAADNAAEMKDTALGEPKKVFKLTLILKKGIRVAGCKMQKHENKDDGDGEPVLSLTRVRRMHMNRRSWQMTCASRQSQWSGFERRRRGRRGGTAAVCRRH